MSDDTSRVILYALLLPFRVVSCARAFGYVGCAVARSDTFSVCHLFVLLSIYSSATLSSSFFISISFPFASSCVFPLDLVHLPRPFCSTSTGLSLVDLNVGFLPKQEMWKRRHGSPRPICPPPSCTRVPSSFLISFFRACEVTFRGQIRICGRSFSSRSSFSVETERKGEENREHHRFETGVEKGTKLQGPWEDAPGRIFHTWPSMARGCHGRDSTLIPTRRTTDGRPQPEPRRKDVHDWEDSHVMQRQGDAGSGTWRQNTRPETTGQASGATVGPNTTGDLPTR